MRSEKVHIAVANGTSRFEICTMVAKGMRATHKNGTRMQDSINNVMEMIGPKAVVAVVKVPVVLK